MIFREESISSKETNPLDSSYKGVPTFAEWNESLIDTNRWDQAMTSLRNLGEISSDVLLRARLIIKFAAASYNNASEYTGQDKIKKNLPGTALAAMWEEGLNENGVKDKTPVELQLPVYEYVMDFASRDELVSEVWIRGLHALICRDQNTYLVSTADDIQESTLRMGVYKQAPNFVTRGNEETFHYAPVKQISAEMHKYCQELGSNAFPAAHPIFQASYAHYALSVIHPFADGNGRVARALSFMFMYRANSIPMLDLVRGRREYLSSLAFADQGNFRPFINLVLERALDAISLIITKIQTAI